MRNELKYFQKSKIDLLRMLMSEAMGSYHNRTHVNQVVSLQAPTGSGKTIMVASLIENIYNGCTTADGKVYSEQPGAIFVWLSDSPELNFQSKEKIESRTSKLRVNQCECITAESFDREMLEDGKIYFLNTQKISAKSKLVTHSDSRQYTIWETMNNTIREKSDRLYFIIDEAHRGAKTKKESGTDTTIMQRFILGYDYYEDGIKHRMEPMPVVLGMSATAQRFNTLIGKAGSSLQHCIITPDEVRDSGLLKDRIAVIYPSDTQIDSDFALLEQAVMEWKKKCEKWKQYSEEQHKKNVDPVLVIQVRPGNKKDITETSLEDLLTKLEEKNGSQFSEYEIVHCFGDQNTITVKGLPIHHVNASEIEDDHKIKVVLFKEALSTGWDCPRAETMMSFSRALDPTYIAQLLGRMVRTPLHRKIEKNDYLNDVKLYLPHFDRASVDSVINEFKNSEGGDIPTEINGESLEEPTYTIVTVRPPRPSTGSQTQQRDPNQVTIGDIIGKTEVSSSEEEHSPCGSDNKQNTESTHTQNSQSGSNTIDKPEITETDGSKTVAVPPASNDNSPFKATEGKQTEFEPDIDREEIINYINSQGFKTYCIRKDKTRDYLSSLLNLADLLCQSGIYLDARNEIIGEIIKKIEAYISNLHRTNKYDEMSKHVLEFKLAVQMYDAFGTKVNDSLTLEDLSLASESDIDRQFRDAENTLNGYGFGNAYGKIHYNEDYPNEAKIDFILFTAENGCRDDIEEWAKRKFHDYQKRYRIKFANKSEDYQNKYHSIAYDGDSVSEQLFGFPEDMYIKEDDDGIEYKNHLFVGEENRTVKIKFNSSWESELIDEESKKPDFVSWYRNTPSNKQWSLCIPRDENNEKKSFYPDFLIIRHNDDRTGYIVDILEPHGKQFSDNLSKAKALAWYAGEEMRIGRIQLIHKEAGQFVRLELTDPDIADKVIHANSDDDLKNIFYNYGFVY